MTECFLVDTNVVSVGAASRERSPDLALWMEEHSSRLYLSTVTVAELADGIAKLRREGATRRAAALKGWLEAVLHLYGARVLSFDVPTALIAGGLSDLARGRGHAPGFADVVIGATAQRHGLTVLTRNTKHFAPLDVPALNPFARLPQA